MQIETLNPIKIRVFWEERFDFIQNIINNELNKCYEEISKIIDFSYDNHKKINYDESFIREHVKKLTS